MSCQTEQKDVHMCCESAAVLQEASYEIHRPHMTYFHSSSEQTDARVCFAKIIFLDKIIYFNKILTWRVSAFPTTIISALARVSDTFKRLSSPMNPVVVCDRTVDMMMTSFSRP